MANPDRNAAIWYSADGYDPANKGINGRRVAGESFLRGFLQHVDADELQAIVAGHNTANEFAELARPYAGSRSIRPMHIYKSRDIDAVSAVHYPAPNIASEAWRRYHFGQTSFSITGITHTTATANIMQAMFDLRTAPIEPWDGIICTSKSVLDQVHYQFDLFDSYAAKRFGTRNPARPQTKLIPLGIHTQDFEPDAAMGAALRADLGIGSGDIVFMVLSRLSAHEKFDPMPVYRALSIAQKQTGQTVHLVLCGFFADATSEKVFRQGAVAAMPKVSLHVVDGKDAHVRKSTFSAADIFLFPIDNIQETFGIAPIEAMAAGLPVIASDWDGLRDTVTPDVGIRIPTTLPSASDLAQESFQHQVSANSYVQYTMLTASMTVLDVPKLARAMETLIRDPDMRRRMGQAGQQRARDVYDWAHVIPQMQDFWEELAQLRKAAINPAQYTGMDVPVAPNVGHMFASYPTHQGTLNDQPLTATPGATVAALKSALNARQFERMRRMVEANNRMEAVLRHFLSSPTPVTPKMAAGALDISQRAVTRCCHFLLKYDLLRVVDESH